MNITEILLRNNLVAIESNTVAPAPDSFQSVQMSNTLVTTLVSNVATYGYAFSKDALVKIANLTKGQMTLLWTILEPNLKSVSGADRKMDDVVVYKNFPKEVLDMSQHAYWVKQILMYMGFHKDNFTQAELDRPSLFEERQLKVLHLADDQSIINIFTNLVTAKTKWTDFQSEAIGVFYKNFSKFIPDIVVSSDFGFKDNLISILTFLIANKLTYQFSIKDATDVLRLCASLSEADASLRTAVKFKKFARSERKMILKMLLGSNNLSADIAARPTLWKKLFAQLHPGEYREFAAISAVYDKLYKGELHSFNSQLDTAIAEDIWKSEADKSIKLLETRPGDFYRRLHQMYSIFGIEAFMSFTNVVPSLTTLQLLKLKKYLLTINDRKTLTVAPNGNWTKLQILPNNKTKISREDNSLILKFITKELKSRINAMFPLGVKLDDRATQIKLATNDQELAEYGRGTVFDIPDNINFLRSASYWKIDGYETIWYDNGWNFFNDSWKSVGALSWTHPKFGNNAALFSGDPVNSKNVDGNACQMIDLYLDKLDKEGVRYAVWNVLCYSKKSFNAAEEVLASLQMGEQADNGKLYDPSRAQMIFPLKGDNYTKYVAYVDVKLRKLVYIDANLYGNVSDAYQNGSTLEEKMPAFLEYLDTLPSVADLMIHAKSGETPFLYDDKDVKIETEQAYVFKPTNPDNSFESISITKVLG